MAVQNHRYSLLLLCLIALLLVTGSAQRGGSRSSSSSKSSRSSRSYYHSSSSHSNQNCTTVNGTTTCTYVDEPLSWTVILIILAIFGGLLTFGIYSSSKDEERRKGVIEKTLKDYEARVEEWPSILEEGQRSIMLDAFMKRSYTMVINIRDKAEKFYCQIKVLDLKREGDTKYRISMSGSDEVGKSKLDGLLVFKADGFGFKLSKVYDDRSKAEQTGKFDILLYEGTGNPDKVDGEWAFYGYETSTEYAGTWTMIEI